MDKKEEKHELNDIKLTLQFINWKAEEMAQSAEDFLLYHKFGHVSIGIV